MPKLNRNWLTWTVMLGMAVCIGCSPSDPDGDQSNDGDGPSDAVPAAESPDVPLEAIDQTPPAITEVTPSIPTIAMPQSLKATCLVEQGGQMPVAELPDLGGTNQVLPGLYGEKLTVLIFWTLGEHDFTAELAGDSLRDLQKEVAEPYAAQGVKVIGVNEYDPADTIGRLVNLTGVTYPMFQDPGNAFFSTIATERLPRIYLLDKQGKILWFDTEFSRTTRDNLDKAIRIVLDETGG